MMKAFNELFEEMKEGRKQLAEGNIPPDHGLELLRQELRRDMGCPDDESLCGLVDGRLKERNFRDWLAVWDHEQIERCAYCQEDIKDLEEVLLIQTKSAEPATLSEVLQRAARHHNLPDALNYKRDGKWHPISSKEMLGRAVAIALGLYSLGVRRGDRVALMSGNCPEWTITDAGCQLAGVVDVAIPPKRLPEDARDAMVHTGVRVLFIRDRAAYARIAEAVEDCAALEHVVFFDEGGAHEAGRRDSRVLTLAEIEARGRALDSEQPALVEELARAVRPRDLATIIYTSGTTGKKGQPKPVMLTQENLVSNILACYDHFAPTFYRILLRGKSLVSLPIWHAPGRITLYVHLHQGMRVYYAESDVYADESSSLEKIRDNIGEVHPAVLIGTPNLFKEIREGIKQAEGGNVKASALAWSVKIGKRWAECKVWDKPIPTLLELQRKLVSLVFPKLAVGGRIRLLISVETALPEEIAWFYKGVGLPILQGYGLTEASPVIALGHPADNQIGTVGQPLKNVEVRPSAEGELEVRGPNVMVGYYKMRDLTEEVLTEDGWLKTGDLGTLIEGRYWKIDQHGKLINIKLPDKTPISLEPIEGAIKGLPFVEQAQLSYDGTYLLAKVWPDFESLLSDEQFEGVAANTAECRQNPAIIKYFQRQVDSLPQCRAHNIHVDLPPLNEKPLTTVTGKTLKDARETEAA